MGIYSGNGMGPAFRAYWPTARSGKAMQLALDKRHRRDPETLAAICELQRVANLNRHIDYLVQEAIMSGTHPLQILKMLADEIRHAEQCDRALKASKG